ncbi:MAG TPA: exosortase-associated EpsI family protein, partial [Prosthecobacter sp.]|nr:exosortase-associated EpsI family protein [Prosthecobacter sp.]
CSATDIAYRVGPPGVRLELPTLLAGFASHDEPMTAREQAELNEDVQIERRFYTSPQRVILAALVLSGAEKRSLHSPDVCLPSQGWIFGGQTTVQIDLGNGKEASAALISMHRDIESAKGTRVRQRALNIYWYQGSDETTCASYNEHVSRTYMDAVFRNMNHRWALISFFTPWEDDVTGMEGPYAELAALEDTKAFIRQLMPQVLAAAPSGS